MKCDVKILIADNGSCDGTSLIAQELCDRFGCVSYLRISEKGVGAAVKEGILASDCDVVGYMDIDLSTDVRYFSKVVALFEKDPELEIVNGSRFGKGARVTGRKWYRLILSRGLVFVLKLVFGMKASDAICGFKFFEAGAARRLLAESSDEKGWFLIIEMLLRAERNGMKIHELPVRWKDDKKNSKVDVVKTVLYYLRQIVRLRSSI